MAGCIGKLFGVTLANPGWCTPAKWDIPLAIHSCGRSLTAAKAPASNHHSTHVHDLSAADRAQQQCRSQLAVSRLQWELAHSSLLSRHITTIPVATPKKLMTLQKNTSSSRTSLVQVQRDRGMHAWCMGRIYTLHVRDVRVLLFPVCIELLTTSSSIRSSHLHAGDEVIVGPDGERRVLKPWPQVSTWHLAVKSQCSDPSTSCQSNVAEALLTGMFDSHFNWPPSPSVSHDACSMAALRLYQFCLLI